MISMENNSASLTFRNVSYKFGNTPAVSDFSLEVKKGSFTTLLGPSGCVKTTLLRLVSGFLTPDSGSIIIEGQDQKSIPAEKRQIGMVFQDYALFPHLTVQQNLLYGLKIQKGNSKENIARIHKTARILGIANLLDRFPHALSGGQQQRVALGRALVLEPKILLMDEPLSSLDAKLRTQVREELKEIQSQVGITTLYVTHDQEEALSLSDNIAVLNHGKLLQMGTPRQIYFNPDNEFVADFVGRANFVTTADGKRLAVRPEWFEPVLQNEAQTEKAQTEKALTVSGTVLSSSFLGQNTRYRIRLNDGSSVVVTVDVPAEENHIETGSFLTLRIKRFLELKK